MSDAKKTRVRDYTLADFSKDSVRGHGVTNDRVRVDITDKGWGEFWLMFSFGSLTKTPSLVTD